jgi:hypothetical protein
MIYHVLAGDSLAADFNKTAISGKPVICREALIAGPVDAPSRDEFWEQRARFILAEYGEDEIVYHERVADELEKLSEFSSDDEVNLWFEYELFCSVNMWFCLSLLSGTDALTYRVEPSVRQIEDRWKGFGSLDAGDLRRCYEARKQMSAEDVELGTDLWNAYRHDDRGALIELSRSYSPRFPYLEEVCDAALERDSRPAEIIAEIQALGIKEFDQIFPEFVDRAGVYGYGDLQVKRLLDQLST